MNNRLFILIDGSNFYHRLKELELAHLLTFNYAAFSKLLARDTGAQTRRYYIAAVQVEKGNIKSEKLEKAQRKLLQQLVNSGWEYILGHMMKTDSLYHEKGVDVRIATDLLIGAYENLYDTAILVSSDTDLIPAIRQVRKIGKRVEYIGFQHKKSYGLMRNTDKYRLLKKEDIEKFIKTDC
ncbi:MAG: NYN domain-containing protein [Patescibacteria group bacterium]